MTTTRRVTVLGALAVALTLPGCPAAAGGSPDVGTGASDGGTDGGAGNDAGSDAAASDAATRPDTSYDGGPPSAGDAHAGPVVYCTSAGGCSSSDTCEVALCSTATPAEGFCAPTGRPTCGGFGGGSCPPGEFSQCLGQGSCVADANGICVTAAERADICAHQATLWGCP